MAEWLTVAQAAEELGVSIATVRRRIHDGTLTPHHREVSPNILWLDADEVRAVATPKES